MGSAGGVPGKTKPTPTGGAGEQRLSNPPGGASGRGEGARPQRAEDGTLSFENDPQGDLQGQGDPQREPGPPDASRPSAPPPGSGGEPSLDPRALVSMALRFYGALLAVAWLWRTAWLGEPLLYASAQAAARGVAPLRDVGAGLLAAGAVIGISYQWTEHTRSGKALARALASLLGPLTLRQVAVLALLSGIAEEAFFRGALQPRVGLVAASVIFGLAHFVPRRELRAWTVFSLAAGFLLGFLFDATGNLVAPVVTHVAVNGVNLTLMVRDEAARERG